MNGLSELKQYKNENKELNKQLKQLITKLKKLKDGNKQAQLYDEIKITLDAMSSTSKNIELTLRKIFE